MNVFEHIVSRVDLRGGRSRALDRCADQCFEPPMPAGPTDAMPGSAAKHAILAKRVEDGEGLWHPGDRVCFDLWRPC